MSTPDAKLPHTTLPTIRSVPAIPHVGSPGATGLSYIGAQFGNLPDLHALAHLKSMKKALEEQVYALIQGKLPFATRPPIYDARAVQLTSELADLATLRASVIAALTNELTTAINSVNGKSGEMNAKRAVLQAIPAGARRPVERLMIQRYQRYAGDLDAQAGRLAAAVASLSS